MSARISPAFGHWLAGFVDGEGCFYIGRIANKGYVNYRCAFTIALRADDRHLLETIQETIGLGHLVERPPRHVGTFKSTAPMVAYEVGSKAGARVLADIFNKYPLRSKKSRDFKIWCEALEDWETKSRGRAAKTGRHDWSRMAELHEELKAVRRYAAA